MGLFDGKVVIVTGAGGGLGRAHALQFAAQGARVVVNDLGGTRDGSGGGSGMADSVVAEIIAAGGQAVADTSDVASTEGGEAILRAALTNFGRVDVLVNNAGILRDKSFLKLEEAHWDLVIRVHTRQLFAVTQPVVRWMTDHDVPGRIINTSSLAGLLGNYGQTNYATAKAGVAGFTRTLAKELKKKGVTVNAVAPVAKTRMTEDIDMVPDDMLPEQISKMVMYLASDLAAGVSGRVFGVHGQQIFEYVMHQTDGVTKAGAEHWSVEEIHARFGDITREQAAAAAPTGGTDEVTTAFSCIPKGFKPEGAKGWNAVLHWKISGGTDQTLTVADGACTHAPGLVGTPTCTVKTDHETVLAMFGGKLNPTKAFMSGKISADNLPDMMKMGGAFDFASIGAAIAAASAGAGPTSDPVSEAFAVLPFAFSAAAAGDWKTVIHFVVKGGTSQTLRVADGKSSVEAGLSGSADCVVNVDVDTIIGMFNGTVDGMQAFMQGKVTATDLTVMMQFSQVFKPDAEAAKKAAAARGVSVPAAAPPKKRLDLREAIGRRYSGDYVIAEGGPMQAYALATNDPNPRYLDATRPGGTVAPPLFPVRLFQPLMFQCVGDPDLALDILRLVHGEEDLTWHAPLHPGDIVNLRATLEFVSQKAKGCVVGWRMLGLVGGETRVEAAMSVFVRGQMLPGVEPGATFGTNPAPAETEPVGAPVLSRDEVVAMDQPRRYAAASLDDNPIHLDEAVARSAGHPSVILHGLCTMAFGAKAIVDGLLDGDPTGLRRFAVRFTRPVLPGWTLTTQAWEAGSTAQGSGYVVRVSNQEGVLAASGWAEIAGA